MRALPFAMLVLVGSACDGGDGTSGGEAGTPACETEERADTYVPGLRQIGDAGLVVTLVSSVPAPPQKGDNHWSITVTDGAGTAQDGLDIAVVPIMPDHGHGTPITALVAAGEEPGTYELDRVNLMMAGYWETTLNIGDGADTQVDTVMFPFCVEE